MPSDLDARIAEWRKSLLDTTKRNRLIKFVAGRLGGVNLVRPTAPDLWARLVRDGGTLTFPWKRDLLGLPREMIDAEILGADFDPRHGGSDADPADLAGEFTTLCLRSPRLRPEHLLSDFSDRHLAARLTRLYRNAKESETDHGVTTLFAAFGFLRWFDGEDSTDELLSPLLLVPVRLDRETVESEYTLAAEEDDILPNYCLAELLQAQFRIKLPTAVEFPLDPENPDCLAGYCRAVTEKVKHVPRWGVVEAAALGVFNFQKLAMWEDLGRNAERVKAHPLCRAIAGDSGVSLAPPAGLPAAEELDRAVSPEASALILDADSSQQEAVEAVKRGAHLVMDGPPGTGKSQTIANMIAEALAAGKTVLFVSEKTAALDVVKRRLDRCGLGDFCLELHSHKANKKAVVGELGRCLDLKPAGVPDTAAQLRELGDLRRKLNEFVAELHAVRQPLGWSAYRVHGELARLDRTSGRSRVALPDVFAKDAEYVRRGGEILGGLADCRAVIDEKTGHPWRGCKLTTFSHTVRDDAAFHLTRLAAAIPAVERAAAGLSEVGVGDKPFTIFGWRAAEADARGLFDLPFFPAEWFTGDPRKAAADAIELHRATVDLGEVKGRLAEFDMAATGQLDAATVAAMQTGLVADRERLPNGATLAARARFAALSRAPTALTQVQEAAGELGVAAERLAGRLHLTTLPDVKHSKDVAVTAAVVAKGGPVPRSWWDMGRWAELFTVAGKAAVDARDAQASRVELVKKYSPAALAPEASALAREANRAGGSFLSRLLPHWWKLKKQVAAWYTGEVPSGAAFRTDLSMLADYHRRSDAVRAVASAYGDELVKDASGTIDWPATLHALWAVDVLRQNGVPGEFRTATGPGGSLDRAALGEAAAGVERTEQTFRNRWETVTRELVIADPESVLARRPAEVCVWAVEELRGVERESAALGKFVSVLAAGRDAAGSVIGERAAGLARLVELRERVRSLSAGSPTADEPALKARADLAARLLAFLDTWGRPVSRPLAAALTEPAARDRVRGAVKASEAARPEFDKVWDRVTADLFDPDAVVSTNLVLTKTPLPDLAAWATARAADAGRLFEWVRFNEVEKAATGFGVAAIIDEVKAGEFRPEDAAAAFRARFYRLWLDALHQQVPALAAFATDAHERGIARFAELDRLAIRTAPGRVCERLITNPLRPRARDGAPDASELGLLLREVNKKRRHLPLRHLFRQIPAILPRIKPCLMMSPLAVSTYLDTPELTFDLVIFDEASQVRPHDAVCAIYRARQLVVGGDPRQLPPTDFFTRTGEEGDEEIEESGTAGFESLLDVCLSLGLTRKRLRWHYRSRREGLIAFSNRYFYDGRLVTFPSADEATGPAVGFVTVPDGRFKDGVNVVEAKRVAALVMEHARTTPDRSLGVIAFSQRQQTRILDELEVLRRGNTDAEAFFAEGREDPFFVKNLENVQGDERDVIVLSVGYGPDESGKVAMRFGPLNRTGGERRLNVAVTRARRAMTVVSSMTAGDIDLTRTGAEGAKVLRAFLDYAARGPVALEPGAEAARKEGESAFEQEVGDELQRRGLTVHRRVGCGGYLVDLAVTESQTGGRYLLGVECDGTTYHAAATARDRDRLRRAVLEGLGWRLVRVWSGDWVRDRDGQVKRVLAALDAAKKPLPEPPRDPEPEKTPVVNWRPVNSTAPEYDSIEVVPETALSDAIAAALTEFGSMPAEDLITAVSKRLGFKRTGPKIRERIAAAMNALVGAGKLDVTEDSRVRLLHPRGQ